VIEPGKDGAEGLVEAMPALFEVISKPFDLDEGVDRVRQRLTAERGENGRPAASRPSSRSGDHGHPNCPDPIELILYVTAHSPHSALAIQKIKAVLSRFQPSRISLTICDLSQDAVRGSAKSVTFTPMLGERSPGPRTFILGHLTNPALVLELLEGCDES
jgi:hypothetical protein